MSISTRKIALSEALRARSSAPTVGTCGYQNLVQKIQKIQKIQKMVARLELLFSDVAATRQSIRDDPAAGVQTLLRIRDVTFGWLHEVAERHGVGA